MRQLMHSFQGTTAPPEILEAVRRGDIGSFCLFANINAETPAQVRALNESLRAAAEAGGSPPPLIGIDQEGGQLIAITGGATELPGNMALGATGSTELAEAAGRVLARELLAMGINLNFAPSLDVNVNPANPVIGLRSFGDDPQQVAALGVAMIRGMQAEGVIATAKHFPGHGDTGTDPHFMEAVIPYEAERLNRVELAPFRAAIEAGVGAVMSGHIRLIALDAEHPATISHVIMTDLLRHELGFEGLSITDAMDMHAVARLGKIESVAAALEAGVDLVLLGHLPGQLDLIAHFAPFERSDAVARIESARRRMSRALPPLDVVGCAEHQQIARTIAEQSITQVKGIHLPLQPAPDDTIAVITPIPENLTPADTSAQVRIALAGCIAERHPRTLSFDLPMGASNAEIVSVLQAVQSASIVIVGTINAANDPSQVTLVRELVRRQKQPVVIALRTPYDLAQFPQIEDYLCTYGIRPVSMKAVTRVLFGEIAPQGVLPCAIPDGVH